MKSASSQAVHIPTKPSPASVRSITELSDYITCKLEVRTILISDKNIVPKLKSSEIFKRPKFLQYSTKL